MSAQLSGPASKLLAVALLGALIAGLYFGGAVPLWKLYQSNLEEIEQQRDNLARFSGLAANLDALLGEVEALEASQATTAYMLPETSENLAAAALQERIKSIVTRNGAKLASTQVLQSELNDRFVKVQVNVRMTGTTESLQRVLHQVESTPPYLVVDNLTVRARTVRGSASSSNANREQIRMDILMRLAGFIRDEKVQPTS